MRRNAFQISVLTSPDEWIDMYTIMIIIVIININITYKTQESMDQVAGICPKAHLTGLTHPKYQPIAARTHIRAFGTPGQFPSGSAETFYDNVSTEPFWIRPG
jgi:hypothetical protein